MAGNKPAPRKAVAVPSNCIACGDLFDYLFSDYADFHKCRLDKREFCMRPKYSRKKRPQSLYCEKNHGACFSLGIRSTFFGVRLFKSFKQYIAAHEPICREVRLGEPSDTWPPTLKGEPVPNWMHVTYMP